MDPSKETPSIYGVWMEGNLLCVLTRRVNDPTVKKIIEGVEYTETGTVCEGIVTYFKLKM